MSDKRLFREKMKSQLAVISKPDYEHYSYLIAKTLYNDKFWKEADTVGITVSKMPEVDTYQIIRRGWEEGKKVVIPKCYPNNRTMEFRTLTAFNQLESVYAGLFEPKEELTLRIEEEKIDLLIVPGLAFSKHGYRLGFGGGYYDRFLQGFRGKTLSLAINLQIVQDLPVEAHDLPVSKIITEQESIEING